jgi:hypothetical protein
MKKQTKTQMYSKMYLITPMVYEKVKNHLDKSDRVTLTNVNKPYFTPRFEPKFEFHGSNYYPGPGFDHPQGNPGPGIDQPQTPYNPMTQPEPTPSTSTGIKREPTDDMDWTDFGNIPAMETQTNPMDYDYVSTQHFPRVDQQTQTIKPVYQETQTQTGIPTHQETQTYIPKTEQQETQTPFAIDQQTQTIRPVTESQGIQTEPSTISQGIQTDPHKRKSTSSTSVQTTDTTQYRRPLGGANVNQLVDFYETTGARTKQKRKRKQTVPVTVDEPVVSQPRIVLDEQSHALVPVTNRGLSVLQRRPITINIPREVLQNENIHRMHYGQQMPMYQPELPHQHQQQALTYDIPSQQALTYEIPSQQLALTQEPIQQIPAIQHQQLPAITQEMLTPLAITHQQEDRTQPEYVVSIPQSREMTSSRPPNINLDQTGAVALSEPVYTVEMPPDTPRLPSRDDESEPQAQVFQQYSRVPKRKRERTTTHITTIPTENIDLPAKKNKPKRQYPCDMCSKVYSSKFNLNRHRAKELQQRDEVGRIPDVPGDDLPPPRGFTVWNFPKKRSSTDASFVPRQHRKRRPGDKDEDSSSSSKTTQTFQQYKKNNK